MAFSHLPLIPNGFVHACAGKPIEKLELPLGLTQSEIDDATILGFCFRAGDSVTTPTRILRGIRAKVQRDFLQRFVEVSKQLSTN